MFVVSPSGLLVVGDHVIKDSQHHSTNEKIIIDDVSVVEGDYTVHIFAGHFFDSNISTGEDLFQEFSVVATGDIDNKYIEFKESTEFPCKKNDPEHPDRCLGNKYVIGSTCKTRIDYVENQTSYYTKLKAMEIHRVQFTLPKKIKSVSAYHSAFKELPTIWVSESCHMSLSEYDVNGKVGVGHQIETQLPFETNRICVAIFNNYFRDDAFFHIELFTHDDDDDGGDNDDDNNKYKNLSKIFFICLASACLSVVVLSIIVAVLVIKLKKKNDEDNIKSAETGSRNTPLLHFFLNIKFF
ncbi:hypothetical protein M9Y10_037731 [Tritrichomonas musculus]|uniref:Peptidase S1 domain-containing protein n=1 Tax=Tritrichomonas musculus TaxID=1915356 RepID=A0ABR2GSC5_9EUKA